MRPTGRYTTRTILQVLPAGAASCYPFLLSQFIRGHPGWITKGVKRVEFCFVFVVRVFPTELHGRSHGTILDGEGVHTDVNTFRNFEAG